jgi:hypothetical protein
LISAALVSVFGCGSRSLDAAALGRAGGTTQYGAPDETGDAASTEAIVGATLTAHLSAAKVLANNDIGDAACRTQKLTCLAAAQGFIA